MTKPPKPKPELEFDLEGNAEDSLSHAVDHFLEARDSGDPKHLKYTILHSFHATELYLKARLQKAHATLIYEKPEDAIKVDAKTVVFDTLLGRLKSVGVSLSEEERKDLDHLRKIRNRIEHHKAKFEIEEAEDYIGRTMRLLEKFLQKELQIELAQKLDADTYRALSEAVHTFEERLERARSAARRDSPRGKDAMGYEWHECPNCNEETLWVPPFQRGSVRCHFCGADEVDFELCSHCSTPILDPPPQDEEGSWSGMCDECESYLMSRD